MAYLQDLPNEILLAIAEYLKPTQEPFPTFKPLRTSSDLAHFVQSSRRVYNLTIPVLYHSFSDVPLPGMHDKMRLVHFVRTLVRAPHLGHHVRQITSNMFTKGLCRIGNDSDCGSLRDHFEDLDGTGNMATDNLVKEENNDYLECMELEMAFSEQDCNHVRKIFQKIKKMSLLRINWQQGVLDGQWWALLALSLCLCPKVLSLSIYEAAASPLGRPGSDWVTCGSEWEKITEVFNMTRSLRRGKYLPSMYSWTSSLESIKLYSPVFATNKECRIQNTIANFRLSNVKELWISGSAEAGYAPQPIDTSQECSANLVVVRIETTPVDLLSFLARKDDLGRSNFRLEGTIAFPHFLMLSMLILISRRVPVNFLAIDIHEKDLREMLGVMHLEFLAALEGFVALKRVIFRVKWFEDAEPEHSDPGYLDSGHSYSVALLACLEDVKARANGHRRTEEFRASCAERGIEVTFCRENIGVMEKDYILDTKFEIPWKCPACE